jgi:RNA methyltransferase, TrmH family
MVHARREVEHGDADTSRSRARYEEKPSSVVDSLEGELTRRFYRAYRDPRVAVLEGFHPARHAVRFGARLDVAVTYDRDRLLRLTDRLAPETAPEIEAVLHVVDRDRFTRLSQRSLSSPLLSIASRPDYDIAHVFEERAKPLVYLDRPRNPGNVGAVIRVAAAADLAAVVVSGNVEPWSPVVIRSATGLQYAIAVGRAELPSDTGRPVVAVDVDGEPLGTARLTADSIFVIGGERYGLSPRLRDLAHRSVGVPMKPGVSSLNLATALSAVLFAWRSSVMERTGSYPW